MRHLERSLPAAAAAVVALGAAGYGDFLGSGGVLHPGRGFEVDAAIATVRGRTAHVTGRLSC